MGTAKGAIVICFMCLFFSGSASAAVKKKRFTTETAYLAIEVLSDRLIHCEVSTIGQGPSTNQNIYTSPMVFKNDFTGPSRFVDNGNIFETREVRIEVNDDNLCVTIKDKARGNTYLTTICPDEMSASFKGLNIDPGQIQNVYGLGQQFKMLGSSEGDWTSLGVRESVEPGNHFDGFQNAAVGNVQIPVMYAVGEKNLNYALFLDNVYKQRWDFSTNWWKVRAYGDQLRYYIMTGPNLPNLRSSYMRLTGTPPVPSRKSFGMWISEFGYDNFGEIDALIEGLRNNTFPVDGFVLDLNWFGGVTLGDGSKSRMGSLSWDEADDDGNNYYFPNPGAKIQQYASDHIGLAVIEESYIANSEYVDTYQKIAKNLLAFERISNKCDGDNKSNPAIIDGFWGKGYMLDWSNSNTGAWVHENKRFPNLVQKGINTHWTDLGEPENYIGNACYNGVEATASGTKNEHSDIHNIYNLLWNKSIWDGYYSKRGQASNLGIVNPRPFVLTRSGTAGTQRFGAAMWSGDIAANLQSLATHMNAQMHMSFSGIDYYSSDSGGFRREVLPWNNRNGDYRGYDNENYTQWFANSAWFDVPVRPHTDNEFVSTNTPYATAPHLIGNEKSNLANIRQRYELIPYYYSLAYRAFLFGEPVITPPVFYYQNDRALREMGHEKIIGRDILVGVVARYGEYERDMYLPAGKWINYHTNEWVTSPGRWFANIPEYHSGIFRLPAFVRAGAIIPQMAIGTDMKDAFGHRKNNSSERKELILKVYADQRKTSFTLYEDDGRTLEYDENGRPVYRYRRTAISQHKAGNQVTVTIDPAVKVNIAGTINGIVNSRQNIVKLVVENASAGSVSLNGTALTQYTTIDSFRAAASGWFNAGSNWIVAKTTSLDVYSTKKEFIFNLKSTSPTSSVNFVCDKGNTRPGESIYILGNIANLGGPNWDVTKAIKLDPNVYWEYIVNPPPGHSGPGPSSPVWTGIVSGIPVNTSFEWKCVRKKEDGTGNVVWQPGSNNTYRTSNSSGYAGRSYGSF